jgi:hypothetical protein
MRYFTTEIDGSVREAETRNDVVERVERGLAADWWQGGVLYRLNEQGPLGRLTPLGAFDSLSDAQSIADADRWELTATRFWLGWRAGHAADYTVLAVKIHEGSDR